MLTGMQSIRTSNNFPPKYSAYLILNVDLIFVCSIVDTPDAPSNLEIESFDKRSCNLKWKAPSHDGGNPIKGKLNVPAEQLHCF